MKASPNTNDESTGEADDGADRTTDDGSTSSLTRRKVLATGGVAGLGALAGCSGVTSPTFAATPAVLTTAGQKRLGLPEFDLAKTTRTRSLAGVGEATITGYLAIHSPSGAGDGDPPYRFDRPAPQFHRLGALSTPAPDVVGDWVNPFASKPFAELLTGERGRQLLHRTGIVDTPEFEWRRGPTKVGTTEGTLLDQPMEAQSYMGVARGGDSPPSTILMNLGRVVTDGNAVMVGEFRRQLTPSDPLDGGGECVDEFCQMPSPQQVDMWRRYKEGLKHMNLCDELTVPGREQSVRVCSAPESHTDVEDLPKVGITNARLVQQVENTVVRAPGKPILYSEPDPDLVKGERTAVVFEFDQLENVDALGGPLEVNVDHATYGTSNWTRESFEIPRRALKDVKRGEDTVSVLHRLANDGSSDDDNPVFEVEDNPVVELSTPTISRFDFWKRVFPATNQSVVDLDPLRIGFIRLQDRKGGARYGNDKGRPKNFRRSFESASEYLRHAYPGKVVAYGHRSHAVVGGTTVKGLFKHNCTEDCVVYRDMKRGRTELNRIATDSSYPPKGAGFPNGGILHTDGLSRSMMVSEIRNKGFDVVVVIVPENDPSNGGATGYYDYHNVSAIGLAFADPAAAVSSLGASATGADRTISTTVAQEVGHYFQQGYRGPRADPMAQRRNDSNDKNQPTVNGKPIDPAHARNQNSNRVSGGDRPGVVSTGYDLKGSFANLQLFKNPNGSFAVAGPKRGSKSIARIPSYMSYTPNDWKAWADARIHQQLIDSGWTPPNSSGSGNSAYMLSASGVADEDGSIRYGDVVAAPGVDRYIDVDDGPVRVELLDAGGSVLERARVPLDFRGSHHLGTNVGTHVEVPSFALPFDEAGVRVRTTHRGTDTVMNPVERSVRDAVDRVPERGFGGDPEAARGAIGDALDDVAAAMADGDYGGAADAMDGPVRERIRERVVAYESLLGEPTSGTLVPLVDEMVGRLRALAETTG